MRPRLPAGALVIAEALDPSRPLNAGDVVVSRRPDRPGRHIIKRVHSIDDAGTIFLVGDNPDPLASTDSRTFGTVTRDQIQGRVRWRLWPLPPGRV
jgi:nickel-type superoxide dismutase maturation protease